MAACGAWSGLLVSRSVSRGLRVWRVLRDDEYVARMLRVLSRCAMFGLGLGLGFVRVARATSTWRACCACLVCSGGAAAR